MSPPIALSAAGSDCSGGAGIQADIKTFAAHGVFGLSVVSAVVAETSQTVAAVHPVPPEIFAEQLQLLLTSYPVTAMKTGMLPGPEFVRILAAADLPDHLVVDPVLTASSGTELGSSGRVEAMRELLFPRAALVTPNLSEASLICGEEVATRQDMEHAGRTMAEQFGCAILVKGGHLVGGGRTDEADQNADDFLVLAGGEGEWFCGPRLAGVALVSHGTGCTLSAAITANLASGESLREAVHHAREYLRGCLRAGNIWPSPKGGDIGALNHGMAMFQNQSHPQA